MLNTDLIIIDTRGSLSFKKMLLGSVVSKIMTWAYCPIIVYNNIYSLVIACVLSV